MQINTDDCWLYAGPRNADQYGIYAIKTDEGKYRHRMAHRLFYELYRGKIPEGLVIDHLCRVRHCVNPEHMEPVTNRVNILRGMSKQAINNRKTHCKYGHSLAVDNIYRRENGWRRCKQCNAQARIEYRRKKRLERHVQMKKR